MKTVTLGTLMHRPRVPLTLAKTWSPPWLEQVLTVHDGVHCWHLDEPGAAEAFWSSLEGVDRIVVPSLPLAWCAQAKPWWSLTIVERALVLGAHEAPRDEVDLWRRHRQAASGVGWAWTPGDWPCPAEALPGRIAREQQALAWQRTALAIVAAQSLTPTLADHLARVEMPAERVHSIITMTGVHLDQNKVRRLRERIPSLLGVLGRTLAGADLRLPEDDAAVLWWLRRRYEVTLDTVEDDELKALQGRDPLIRDLRQWRRLYDLQLQPWLHGGMVGPGGRVYPRNVILGAPTTRIITIDPAITGIQKELRIIADATPGFGIGESDVSSMELCTAAARYGDRQLAELCNTGHALAALAQACDSRLAQVELTAIKPNWPQAYEAVKIVIYGLLYGRAVATLAAALGIPRCQAELLVEHILARCPQVAVGMRSMVRHVERTLCVPIGNGLVRRLTRDDIRAGYRFETLAKNTPIQGLAAIAFRVMVILAAAALAQIGGRIVLVNHDSIVWESPLPLMAEAARIVEEAMRQGFAVTCGDLVRPTIDSTISAPWCWNKNGHADSFDRFLADPTYRIGKR